MQVKLDLMDLRAQLQQEISSFVRSPMSGDFLSAWALVKQRRVKLQELSRK